MPDLFTYVQDPKAVALTRVWHGAGLDWQLAAMEAVRELCRARAEFTADDLEAVAKETHEPRAIGALLIAAKKAGLCEPTERYLNSRLKSCNSRPKRVWRSCVWRQS